MKCVRIVPSRHNLALKDCRKEGLARAGLQLGKKPSCQEASLVPDATWASLDNAKCRRTRSRPFGSLVGRESPLIGVPLPFSSPRWALGTSSDPPGVFSGLGPQLLL